MTTENALSNDGVGTLVEKKRWHHRSKFEAVYEREFDNFDREIERKRRTKGDIPGNANKEVLGQRLAPDYGRPREALLPKSNDRDSREPFPRTPRIEDRSCTTETFRGQNRDDGEIRNDIKEHYRYEERQSGYDKENGLAKRYSYEHEYKRQQQDDRHYNRKRSPARQSPESNVSTRSSSPVENRRDNPKERYTAQRRQYDEHNRTRERSPKSRDETKYKYDRGNYSTKDTNNHPGGGDYKHSRNYVDDHKRSYYGGHSSNSQDS